jgi:hypothetical protein
VQTVAKSHYLRGPGWKRQLGYSDGMLPGSRRAERAHLNMILAIPSLAGAVYALLSSAVIPAFKEAHSDSASTATQPIVSMGDPLAGNTCAILPESPSFLGRPEGILTMH